MYKSQSFYTITGGGSKAQALNLNRLIHDVITTQCHRVNNGMCDVTSFLLYPNLTICKNNSVFVQGETCASARNVTAAICRPLLMRSNSCAGVYSFTL